MKKTKKAVNKYRGDIMRKIFMCSLCHNGVLGGVLLLENEALIYRTNKLTVDKKYRNLVMPIENIKGIAWKWWLFPIAAITMANGEKYKLMIYNKPRFLNSLNEYNLDLKG